MLNSSTVKMKLFLYYNSICRYNVLFPFTNEQKVLSLLHSETNFSVYSISRVLRMELGLLFCFDECKRTRLILSM